METMEPRGLHHPEAVPSSRQALVQERLKDEHVTWFLNTVLGMVSEVQLLYTQNVWQEATRAPSFGNLSVLGQPDQN